MTESPAPAGRAGVQSGDVIVKLNGESIPDAQSLVSLVGKRKPGDEVTLTVERGKETLDLKATLVAAKDMKNN